MQCIVITMVIAFAGVLFTIGGAGAVQDKVSTSTDWPHWRGPQHNGISTETGWLGGWTDGQAKIIWKQSIGTGFSSMAVSRGRIYTMGNTAKNRSDRNPKDVVYCLDADTGNVIWTHQYPCDLGARSYKGGTHATPTVEGDAVYTFSKQGHAFCLDAATGKVKWSRDVQKELDLEPPTWGFSGSARIVGNFLFLNAGGGALALNKNNGEVIWKSQSAGAAYSTPQPFSAGGSKGLAFFTAESMKAVEIETGKLLWLIPWKTSYDAPAADPIFSGDKVFISSGWNRGGGLFKISGSECTKIWENKLMCNQNNSSVLWEGYLYGFSGNQGGRGILRCLDFNTGQMKWEAKGMGTGSLMMADGKLIILSEDGELVIAEASPKGFKALKRSRILNGTCWTVPVLSGGRIYARCAEGDLVCVDVKGN